MTLLKYATNHCRACKKGRGSCFLGKASLLAGAASCSVESVASLAAPATNKGLINCKCAFTSHSPRLTLRVLPSQFTLLLHEVKICTARVLYCYHKVLVKMSENKGLITKTHEILNVSVKQNQPPHSLPSPVGEIFEAALPLSKWGSLPLTRRTWEGCVHTHTQHTHTQHTHFEVCNRLSFVSLGDPARAYTRQMKILAFW